MNMKRIDCISCCKPFMGFCSKSRSNRVVYVCIIQVSGPVAVTVIMSVGIAVEGTAHLVHAFESSVGTRNERMRYALHDIFASRKR